jgi:hypothetical protein
MTVMLALLCAVSCEHPDFSFDLGNGYRMVRANDKETYITYEQSVPVPGKIVQYAVVGDLVVGNVKKPDWPEKEAEGLLADVVEGYFLLDMRARTQSLGLTLSDLRSALQARGVTEVPAMQEPVRRKTD